MIKLAKLNKISKSLKNLLRRLAKNSFLFFLELLLIVLFLGLVIFYYYAFSAKISDEIIEEKLLKLDMQSQQRVLEEWQKRNENFQTVDFKEYSDPFHLD